jgi:MoaA/NifB/PqqE/SkfB family radical SAM enzyme
MHEVNNMKSLSLFVGTGECNANCLHCAGKIHRKYAPKEDGIIDEPLIYKTLKECYLKGARSLSISSSGEPTLSPKSVTRVLEMIVGYNPINLYSNGIRIGEDKKFSKKYLPLWGSLGLTGLYITVHNINERKNAKVYGIEKYPKLEDVVSRIHDASLNVRANIVLTKENACDVHSFIKMVVGLRDLGFDSVSAWPVRNKEDNLDYREGPSKKQLDYMDSFVISGGFRYFPVRILGEENSEKYKKGEKLTLFPDKSLSNKWCNH